jgi:hypothetical protein
LTISAQLAKVITALPREIEQSVSYYAPRRITNRIFRKVITGLFAVLTMKASIVHAQAASLPSASFRQSLDDTWWTGPMLAPSANTLPRGHFLIEPYLYDVTTQGFYSSSGTRVSVPHENSFGSLTYVLYGIASKFTVGMIPVFGYNEPTNGASSAGVGLGDLTLQAQYLLHLFRGGSWIPTMSIAVQETLPTGKYDQLGNRPSDGLGAGAFTTSPAFYSQTFFWLPNGRVLRMRFNVVPAFSRRVSVQDASVYGTSAGFRGHATPGPSVFVDAAGEYSLTKHWVLALDATYRHQGNTPVTGYSVSDPTQPIRLNSGSSDAFGLAPAIEYNWTRNLGVLLGVRMIPAGRNTALTITPAVAVNFVH